MSQSELFDTSDYTIDTDRIIKESSKNLNTLSDMSNLGVYKSLRERGLGKGMSIWVLLGENWEERWEVLWEGFENHGRMVYSRVNLGDRSIWVYESDDTGVSVYVLDKEGAILFSGVNVFVWGENDVFDTKTMSKIKSAVKAWIVGVGEQITL